MEVMADASVGLELVARRLTFWQNAVRYSTILTQFTGVFFGRPRYDEQREKLGQPCAGDTLDGSGCVKTTAHPWARQSVDDLRHRLQYEDASELRAQWLDLRIARLFQERFVRDEFLQLDHSIVRAAFLSKTWSPDGHLQGQVPARATSTTTAGSLHATCVTQKRSSHEGSTSRIAYDC